MRNTNLIIAAKTVVVVGYGWCGRGIAMRAASLGAQVIVTEVNPVKAIEAKMDGYDVMTMEKAAPLGDIFVSSTGCCKTITVDHMLTMKDRSIRTNAGHFDCEVDMFCLLYTSPEQEPWNQTPGRDWHYREFRCDFHYCQ